MQCALAGTNLVQNVSETSEINKIIFSSHTFSAERIFFTRMYYRKQKVYASSFSISTRKKIEQKTWTLAQLKVKISPPDFNGRFLVIFEVFWCKENFSSWYLRTIICDFVHSKNYILLAHHFVDQFLKTDFFVFVYILSDSWSKKIIDFQRRCRWIWALVFWARNVVLFFWEKSLAILVLIQGFDSGFDSSF